MPPSLEPTPVVTCGEHVVDEHLAAYPRVPAGADGEPTDLAAARVVIVGLRRYRTEQFAWAITAAGVTERNAIRHRATASCLDAYRARGVIR
jgi:hypothetical protein